MNQKLEYINQGRSGYVIYKDGGNDIQMYYDFCGGDCIAAINVISAKEWTSRTNRPVEDRLPVLKFTAEQVISYHVPNCRYELSDNFITIFKK